MNVWQVCKQIKYLLQQRKWENDASGSFVFNANSVNVTVGPMEQAFSTMITPVALIRPGAATSDPTHDEEPNLIMQSLGVMLSVVVPGDEIGENALLGAGRQSQTSSKGRGLLEVEEELYASISLLNSVNGLEVYNRAKSDAIAELVDENRYSAYREYTFEVLSTSERFYPSVTRMTAVDAAGAGDATLTYLHAPIRFDITEARILRVSGATPTTNPTDGSATVVAAGGGALTLGIKTVTDSPTAGQFSYSIWQAYDETGNGTVDRYSDNAATATVTVT